MELRHLRPFVLTAETASFSVADSRCYITQSAVSQNIRSFEEEKRLAEQYGMPYEEENNKEENSIK